MILLQMIFLFVATHYLFDVVFQSEKLVRGKNRNSTNTMYDPKVHGPKAPCWIFDLSAHALSHALGVYVVCRYLGVSEHTSLIFALIETVAHWITDFFKCEKKYGIFEDQGLHLGVKWVFIMLIYNGWVS